MQPPVTPPPTVPAQLVRRLAEPLGFAMVGIAPAEPSDHGDYLRQWLAEARHGEMQYLDRNVEMRIDPAGLLAGARSVICVADRHHADHEWAEANSGQAVGRIARYAWGDDYHKIIKKRLHRLADLLRQRWPDEQYRSAVDTAPILERDHAQRAGLGWIGKHTLLIHPRLGSWLLLGQIVTTLGIEPDDSDPPDPPDPPDPSDHRDRPMADHCGTCTRCIDACPTDCISTDGYQLDASRCISYLTIEHRGPIDEPMHALMGDWVAGCDVCQEVCPFNRAEEYNSSRPEDGGVSGGGSGGGGVRREYAPRAYADGLMLLELMKWDAQARQDAFTGSALKRIKLDQLKRNALIAAGNYLARHNDPALHARIEQLACAGDESPLVRQTAAQVLATLARRSGS